MTQELTKVLQIATQERLQQQTRAFPLPACLLDPCEEALCLLLKLTPANNINVCLYTFEQTEIQEGWPDEE